ncbi:hypothetical protein CB0940_09183 [Cercospora beticola]|uniref:Uncharacterized protein n=1 Tax=Cercospora beticola TaxID=122368 RepID=A0A2G5HIA1_CERBT|nr:hypothetical protein CB0940_09183 [Cercospora beticola]PIA92294.1 hypothetical protein CB0940_09183 [Cercospora beticola]WPB06527.1 hypothetical protein RHO25_011184 [Cercospora beticola]
MASDSAVRPNPVLLISIDLGSFYLKCWAKHVPAGRHADDTTPYAVYLMPGFRKIRLSLLIVPDEQGESKLLWGDEVTQHLRHHPEDSHRVFDNIKLALCAKYNHHAAVRHIREVLGCPQGESVLGNIQHVYTLMLEKARNACLRWYTYDSDQGSAMNPDYWRAVPVELKVTIPAMWNETAQSIMKHAALDAGYRNVRLYLEPLCAAAAEMTKLISQRLLEDVAMTRIKAASVPDGRPVMVAVGEAAGDSLGCHVVHELTWQCFEFSPELRRHGGLANCSRLLQGLSEAEMRRQLSSYVEDRMKKPDPRDFPVMIESAAPPGPGELSNIMVKFTGNALQQCIHTWASKIADFVERFLDTDQCQELDLRRAHLTGGGSSNTYVVAELRKALESRHIDVRVPDSDEADMAVARGGLEQYPTNEADDLPEGFYYLCQAEPYDHKRHKDVGMDWKSQDGYRKAVSTTTPKLAAPSHEDPDRWFALDRLQLAYQHSLSGPKQPPRYVSMDFPIDANFNTQFKFDIYFCKDFHRDGSALRSKDGKVKPKFSKFLVELADVEVDSSRYNFEKYDNNGTPYFNVLGLVEISGSAQELNLVVRLLEPGQPLKWQKPLGAKRFDNADLILDPSVDYRYITIIRREIWAPYRSHAISSASRAVATSTKVAPCSSKRRSKKGIAVKRSIGTRSNRTRHVRSSKQPAQVDPAVRNLLADEATCTSDTETIRPPVNNPKSRSVRKRKSYAVPADDDQASSETSDDQVPSEVSHIAKEDAAYSGAERNSLWQRPRSRLTTPTMLIGHKRRRPEDRTDVSLDQRPPSPRGQSCEPWGTLATPESLVISRLASTECDEEERNALINAFLEDKIPE